jgi:hypothetical protein
VRVVSSQDLLSLHGQLFFNRGDVNFSVQGSNGRDDSNTVNRRNPRRSRSLARSQNHVYRQVDGNSTTPGANSVQGSFGPVLSLTLSRGGALIPILLSCILYFRRSVAFYVQ